MEKKLKEYRAKQEKLNKIQRFRENLKTIFSFILPDKTKLNDENRVDNDTKADNSQTKISLLKKRKMKIPEEAESLIIPEDSSSIDDDTLSDDLSIWCCSWLQLFYYFLYLILWGTVYVIFIKLQFGTVYFILSALIFMYLNTRTSPKRSGEVSAYSVFNKDCVSINGTLKAEQFEREIMFGAGSVR